MASRSRARKEYIEIVRKIFAREAPLQHRGEHYQIPYAGPDATGLGKPLKSILHANPDLKIYTAAISPAGLRTAGEVADGVQPFVMSPERADIVTEPVLEGRAAAGKGRTLADFDIAPFVTVVMGKDVQACRDAIKPHLALYIGGMGARGKNFYNDYAKRLGYEAAAVKIQDAYLAGRRDEAIAAVPDSLIDETALVGPPERIKDRLEAWKECAQGRQDRQHVAGRGQHRGAARHRRGGALAADLRAPNRESERQHHGCDGERTEDGQRQARHANRDAERRQVGDEAQRTLRSERVEDGRKEAEPRESRTRPARLSDVGAVRRATRAVSDHRDLAASPMP